METKKRGISFILYSFHIQTWWKIVPIIVMHTWAWVIYTFASNVSCYWLITVTSVSGDAVCCQVCDDKKTSGQRSTCSLGLFIITKFPLMFTVSLHWCYFRQQCLFLNCETSCLHSMLLTTTFEGSLQTNLHISASISFLFYFWSLLFCLPSFFNSICFCFIWERLFCSCCFQCMCFPLLLNSTKI